MASSNNERQSGERIGMQIPIRHSSSQRDCIDVTAIVRFGAMGRATETEKSRWVGVRAQLNILDLPDAGPREPRGDIPAEIELGMAVALRRAEESIAAGILGGKTRNEIGTDLVIALPDHWAERGANVVARGAEPLHCRDRRLS